MTPRSPLSPLLLIVCCIGLAGALAGCDGDDDPVLASSDAPEVSISSPAGGTPFTVGTDVTLEGAATDWQDEPLTGESLVWTSDKDGWVGTGLAVTTNSLSQNAHVVTLTATDARGVAGHASITIHVFPPVSDDFVLVPAGSFTMGSPSDELGRGNDEVPHEVTLTAGFRISRYEVTEALWARVMGGASASQLPMVGVSWYDAILFCNTLSDQEGLSRAYEVSGTAWTWNRTADGYRLPSEAEWEYACRAGSTTAFANGPITNAGCDPVDPNLGAMGWYCGNADNSLHAVGQKQANAWGLCDMHGNVWEWCWDWCADYPAGPWTDPVGPDAGFSRVIRGGNFYYTAKYCRSALRRGYYPGDRYFSVGFRLARAAG